jgi:hypothetical protein
MPALTHFSLRDITQCDQSDNFTSDGASVGTQSGMVTLGNASV